jgi:hypothetical protein
MVLVVFPTNFKLDKYEMKELFEQSILHKTLQKFFSYICKAKLLRQMEQPALWGRPKCIRLLYKHFSEEFSNMRIP